MEISKEDSQLAGTSGNQDDGQIENPNDDELNEALEKFAQTYNLTTQNVKNIIFVRVYSLWIVRTAILDSVFKHIVKNPRTFATLVGEDPEAVAGLRLTRSRLRELEKISNTTIPIELKPVSIPRTFLDVNYNNDDEDADYEQPVSMDAPDGSKVKFY